MTLLTIASGITANTFSGVYIEIEENERACEDETYTVSPGSPLTINYVSRRHDNCTWTVNVAPGYQRVSIALCCLTP